MNSLILSGFVVPANFLVEKQNCMSVTMVHTRTFRSTGQPSGIFGLWMIINWIILL